MPSFAKTLFLFAFACATAQAQAPGDVRVGILREVNADGALIALALHCKHSSDDVNRLGDKLEALTLALAKSRAVALDAHTYHEAARDGFLHMREVLALTSSSEASYREQCAEVNDKIAKKMAQ